MEKRWRGPRSRGPMTSERAGAARATPLLHAAVPPSPAGGRAPLPGAGGGGPRDVGLTARAARSPGPDFHRRTLPGSGVPNASGSAQPFAPLTPSESPAPLSPPAGSRCPPAPRPLLPEPSEVWRRSPSAARVSRAGGIPPRPPRRLRAHLLGAEALQGGWSPCGCVCSCFSF